MDSRCRVCRRFDVDTLVSLSSVSSSQRKQISEMISVTTGTTMDDNDRVPQNICGKCLGQLNQAYMIVTRFRASRLLPECQKGEESQYYRCRVCARQDVDGLIFLTCIHDRWKVTIEKMIHFMVSVIVRVDECLPPYICDSCLKNLDVGFGFKKQYLQSLSAFREETLYAWERMEYQLDNPGHLVAELYAELIPNWTTQTDELLSSVCCSVCKMKIALDQLGKKCEGCLLEFVVSDEIWSQLGESRKRKLCEVDNTEVMDDHDLDTGGLTDMDAEPVEIDKTKHYKGTATIILNVDELFDVIESGSTKPFKKIRRKGPICCGCNQFFLNEEEIIQHRLIQHSEVRGTGKHVCEFCRASFQDLPHLFAHKAQLKYDTYHWCMECKVLLINDQILKRHQFAYHMPDGAKEAVSGKYTTYTKVIYRCCVKGCFYKSKTEEQLLKHCGDHHHNEKDFDSTTCQYCEKSFAEQRSLLRHNNRRIEQVVYRCTFEGCTYEAKRKYSIIGHCRQKPHSYNAKNPWKHNPWKYLQVDKLFEVIAEDSSEPFQKMRRKGPICCGCNQFFLTEEEIIEHRTMQHSDVNGHGEHVCELCRTSFRILPHLLAHKDQLKYDTYHWCKPCKYLLLNDTLLEKHQIRFHIPDRVVKDTSGKYSIETTVFYSCCVNDCHLKFDTEEQLLQHSNTNHYNENLLDSTACQYCEKVFGKEADLLTHINRRIERKLYRCTVPRCSYEAKLEDNMILHCSQKPHVIPENVNKIKNFIPDPKQFTVTGKVNNAIDILELKGELCCGCNTFFDTSDDLLKHREERHATDSEQVGDPLRCTECKRVFIALSKLSVHTNNATRRTYYFCRPCKLFFWNKPQMSHHKIWRHSNDDDDGAEIRQCYQTVIDDFFTCCGCDEQFTMEEDLFEHRQEKHRNADTQETKLRCNLCQKQCINKFQLARHTQIYANKMMYKCSVINCTYQTKKLANMKRHTVGSNHRDIDGKEIAYVRIKNPTDYRCCIRGCEEVTGSYDRMITHGIKCHSTKREEYMIQYENKEFTCLVCCRGFDHKSQMFNHKNGRPTLRCPKCGATFQRAEYRDHIKQCSTTNTFKCEICSKQLKSERFLAYHMRSHQVPNKNRGRTICSVCGKAVLVNNIGDHMQGHENKRSWACKLCPLRFNTKTLLRLHARVHNNEKNFGCRYGCENRYKAAGDRDRHEKLVHLGIKPFSCQFCSESFVRDRDLRLHGRKHTGLKLFPCESCGDSFDRLSEFKQHSEKCGQQ